MNVNVESNIMNKYHLHPVFQPLIFLFVSIGGSCWACSLSTAPPHWRVIWIACGAILLLRITGVHWTLSVLAAVFILILYFAGIAFVKAWAFA